MSGWYKQAPWEGVGAGPTSRGPQESRGRVYLKVKNEMGNYAQSSYYYNFVHTVLCKLIDWSCFSVVVQCIVISFGALFGKIPIAAFALLAQRTKFSVTCRNSRKYAWWRHIQFYSPQYCYGIKPVFSVVCGWELHMLRFLWFLMTVIPP